MAGLSVSVLGAMALVTSLSALFFMMYGIRYREQVGAGMFAAFTAILAIVSPLVLLTAERLPVQNWQIVPVALFHPYTTAWILFALSYTGQRDQLSGNRLALLLLPSVIGFLDVLYALSAGVSPGPDSGLLYAFYLPTVMYAFTLLFGGAVILLRAGYQYVSMSKGLTFTLTLGAVSPVFLPVVFRSVLFSGSAPDPSSYLLAYLVAVVPFWLAVFKYDFFESVPVAEAIGRNTVVTEMDDAMIVLGEDETVVDMNEAARDLFDTTLSEAGGRPLVDLLGETLATISERDTFEQDGSRRRYYKVTISELSGENGQVRGHTLLFHDVTRRRIQRQRLDVLNRVLRHNLRNKMVSITGRAELIADEEISDPATVAAEIENAGNELVEIGDRARQVEKLMSSNPRQAECEVSAIVDRIFEKIETTFPEATLRNELPDDLTAGVSDIGLRVIVGNLVDNGVRHDDSDRPTVVVKGQYNPDAELPVEIVVADSGPGIPESELAVLREQKENKLRHASGIGLWAVYWGTLQTGGTVEFDSSPDGTRVQLRFPEP